MTVFISSGQEARARAPLGGNVEKVGCFEKDLEGQILGLVQGGRGSPKGRNQPGALCHIASMSSLSRMACSDHFFPNVSDTRQKEVDLRKPAYRLCCVGICHGNMIGSARLQHTNS